MDPMFGIEVEGAIARHAIGVWPQECVGLIVNGEYRPVDNLAADPEAEFSFDKKLMLTPGLQSIAHSHPSGNPAPSLLDMQQQAATALPWGIVACDGQEAAPALWFGTGVPPPPLLGRNYRFGPSGTDGKGDCYAIIKDWYALTRGVELREVPRDEDAYLNKQTPWYDTLFGSYGWTEISAAEMDVGDVVLCRIRMQVTNHAMLYLGNGLGLHHMQNGLSVEEPIGRWLNYAVRFIRYTGSA